MSRAADVYSFSMIMWELFACKRLYEGHIASQVSSQWHAWRPDTLLSGRLVTHSLSVYRACVSASARAVYQPPGTFPAIAAQWHPKLTHAELWRSS